MNRPPTLKPHGYASMRKAEFVCPLGDRHCLAVMCKSSIVRPIISLFFICCPSAVFLKVAFGRIYSVEGVTDWAWAKVCKKRFERMSPRFAHCNSSAAVVAEGFTRTVIAASQHIFPRFALAAEVGAAMRVTSRLCRFLALFLSQAAARFGASAFKFGRYNNLHAAAIALAQPSGVPFSGVFNPVDCRQPSKFFVF